jgi:hypothetical protein
MKCKTCGKALESGLIVCPSCGKDPDAEPEIKLSSTQIKSIGNQVRGEFLKGIVWWLGILSLVFGFGLLQVYRGTITRVRNEMVRRIADEFKQPKIRETMESVASNSAERLLLRQIQPQVDRFKKEMAETSDLTRDLANATQSQLIKLSAEITQTSSNLQHKIGILDARIADAEKSEEHLQTTLLESQNALAELKVHSRFILVAASAQADDRTAYDQLTKWAGDTRYPLHEEAWKIYRIVQGEYWGERGQKNWRVIDWMPGRDPNKLTLVELQQVWRSLSSEFARDFVNCVWNHKTLTKDEKLYFLHGVLSDSRNSLYAADAAARLLADEGKVKYNPPFDFAQIVTWWAARATNSVPAKTANQTSESIGAGTAPQPQR